VDGTISMALALPNHPSYVSGHACVSGAASAVLSHFFPSRAAELMATADEIALSRLYAGVHYRFDNEAGLAIGRAIGENAVEVNPTSADLLSR
jgi:membrane-associated phospholipid phosphatase